MYRNTVSALCLSLMFTGSNAVLAETATDPQKVYAQAQAGDVDAICELSKLFYDGQLVQRDLKASYDWAVIGAERGGARCINNLGVHFYYGTVVKEDEGRAFDLYKQAASMGFAVAERNLGAIHLSGLAGQPRDATLARDWYLRAAKQGDGPSQEQLGFLFLSGAQGVTADLPVAFAWFSAAATQGLPVSQMMAGKMLSFGEGTTKDEAKAVSFWSKAASQGQAGAQVDLGTALVNGTGVAVDLPSGKAWLEKAAAQKEAHPLDAGRAHAALAQIYQKGIGVPADTEQARRHWEKAAELGFEGASEELEAMDNLPAARNAPTAGELVGGLLLLGILGAIASGSGSGGEADCLLPTYTKDWSQAARDYECSQQRAMAEFEEQQKQSQWETECMLTDVCLAPP